MAWNAGRMYNETYNEMVREISMMLQLQFISLPWRMHYTVSALVLISLLLAHTRGGARVAGLCCAISTQHRQGPG